MIGKPFFRDLGIFLLILLRQHLTGVFAEDTDNRSSLDPNG